MITHELKIGERIYDIHDDRWGNVLLIGGKDKDSCLDETEDDTIITYKPDDSDGECETLANNCYPLVENLLFNGNAVCKEINKDTFPYDYFCPERNENCYDFECSEI